LNIFENITIFKKLELGSSTKVFVIGLFFNLIDCCL